MALEAKNFQDGQVSAPLPHESEEGVPDRGGGNEDYETGKDQG